MVPHKKKYKGWAEMRNLTNYDIRLTLFEKGIKQNKIADFLGVNEYTLSRWLRKELPKEKRDTILDAIHKLTAERNWNELS